MSVASEWAGDAELWNGQSNDAWVKLQKFPWTGLTYKDGTRFIRARVGDAGGLHLNTCDMTPEEALALADWIKATFGDGPRA